MKAIVFGATGMVGQAVLRECLLDPEVTAVLSVGRRPSGQTHAKLRDLVHTDLTNFAPVADQLAGYDACFFCLGVSSAGMSEAEYRKITYDVTIAAAKVLAEKNPGMVFEYVSGSGTNAKGRAMWSRVKGETEDALLAMPFKAAYMFRPAMIRPMHGIKASAKATRYMYNVIGPIFPLFQLIAPKFATTTEVLGKAMLKAAKSGAPKKVIENHELAF